METENVYPLVRTNRPPTFLLLIAGLFMLVGSMLMLVFGLYFTGQMTLSCTRQEPTQIRCRMQETTWLGQHSQATELNQVQGMRMQTTDCIKSAYDASKNQLQDEASSCDAMLLQTGAGDVYISLPGRFYSPINDFFYSTQPTLAIIDSHWLFASILGCFGAIGVLASGVLLQAFRKTQSRFY